MRIHAALDEGLSYARVPGGEPVDTLPYDDSAMTISGGPTCVDDFTWWQAARDSGLTGWVAENQGQTYIIAPVHED